MFGDYEQKNPLDEIATLVARAELNAQKRNRELWTGISIYSLIAVIFGVAVLKHLSKISGLPLLGEEYFWSRWF